VPHREEKYYKKKNFIVRCRWYWKLAPKTKVKNYRPTQEPKADESILK